jgi:hypothetical protein
LEFWPRSQGHLLDRKLLSKTSDRSGNRVEVYRPWDRVSFNLAQKNQTFSTLADLSSGVADLVHEISHFAFLDPFGVLAIFF